MVRIPVRLNPKWQANAKKWLTIASARLRGLPWRKILKGGALAALFGIVALTATWLRICAGGKCPDIAALDRFDPDQATKFYAADGRLITEVGIDRRSNVTLKQMSPYIPAAFLAIEDKRFYEHGGFDWVGFFGALKDNFSHFSLTGRGFSTITMQLARNLWPEDLPFNQRGLKGIPRKLREVRVAQDIEKRYGKDKILELYLNIVSLGGNSHGVEAAAMRYFGRHANEMNVAEAAMLAALAKGPANYNPRTKPAAALSRRNLVIDQMQDVGVITATEAETWKGYPVLLSSRADFTDHAQYFIEWTRQLLLPRYPDINTGGYHVYTTLDLDAQIAVETACEEQSVRIENSEVLPGKYQHLTKRAYDAQKGTDTTSADNMPYLQCGALVLEAKTGNVLALVGGRDFGDSKFNRMVQGVRQPGSSFKPLVYTAAIESGQSFDDTDLDTLATYVLPPGSEPPTWTPNNYDNDPTGERLTMRQALWKSVNTMAVRFGLKAGVPAVLEEAKRFGITSRINAVPSIMLGSADVKPIEMIAAYTTFANLGKRSIPNPILRVLDKNKQPIWEPARRQVEVLDPGVAYTMTSALRGVVTNGTAHTAVWLKGFQVPSGGKTGTTSDRVDAWYIGFTPDLVAGVWFGFDLPKDIGRQAQGGLLAAPAYTQFMLEIYRRRRTPADWEPPVMEGIYLNIDTVTGLLASPYCPDNRVEQKYFIKGTEPKTYGCQESNPTRPGGGRP